MNRRILFFISVLSLVSSVQAASLFDKALLINEQKVADSDGENYQQDQRTLVEIKRSLREWQNQRQRAKKQCSDYQKTIKELKHAHDKLGCKLTELKEDPLPLQQVFDQQQLKQQVLFNSKKMLMQNQKIKQSCERKRCIQEVLNEFPTRSTELEKKLSNAKARRKRESYWFSSKKLQDTELQAEIAAYEAQLEALEFEQSAKQRELECVQLDIDVLHASHHRFYQQQAHNKTLLTADPLAAEQLQRILDLSSEHLQHIEQIEEIKSAQQEIIKKSDESYDLIDEMASQTQRRALAQMLRTRVTLLVKAPKASQLKQVVDKFIFQKTNYSKELKALKVAKGTKIDAYHAAMEGVILDILKLLEDSSEQAIEVLAQLERAREKFEQARCALQAAMNRHLFWSPDSSRIDLEFSSKIIKKIHTLFLLIDRCSFSQIITTLASGVNIALMTVALILVVLGFSLRRRYYAVLSYTAARVRKVHQDNFKLTFSTFLWSLWASLPLPVLVAAMGYSFKTVNEAISDGILATVPVFLALKLGAYFAKPNGLFIKHFAWNADKVAHAIRYYAVAVWLAVPLIVMTITFNNLDEGKFSDTLGRLSFMLFCVVLIVLTWGLRRAGVPLYLNRQESDENVLNYILWTLLISALPLAIFFSALGYLIASQQLLLRLEMSVAIWFGFLMIYYVIRRWMLIQRRRLIFERTKQRRADQLAQRARYDEELSSAEGNLDTEEFVVDLDIISVRSLQLLRSIVTMAALVSLIWLWSEIHPAFVFLESIHLWKVQTVIQGVPSLQPVSLGKGLIALLVLVVTTQLVRNLPALLELSLLQHLDLSPGTGYAITTLTKYLLTLIGVLIFISLLGIDWPKIQWVATALGLGLGFGLKDIFANFISGLILLFEKPVRIGDTVTVRGDLTGTVTKINTRATVITDWDRKEIIMPNHALITEQFVNWTLTDSITRIVLQITAPADVDPAAVAQLLEKAIKQCTLVLEVPPPEIYLMEVQQGVQCFEVRVYANEIGHRMPLRNEIHQQIMSCYREAHIPLPYPPVQVRVETISHRKLPLQPAL